MYSVHETIYYACFLMYITINVHVVRFESHYHVENKRLHTYNVCCVALCVESLKVWCRVYVTAQYNFNKCVYMYVHEWVHVNEYVYMYMYVNRRVFYECIYSCRAKSISVPG